MASKKFSSSSKTVNISTWIFGKWVLTVRTPSIPEILGRPMSIRMMSGRAAPIWLTTLRRLFNDATQRIPSIPLNRLSRLERRVLLSSTIAILIMRFALSLVKYGNKFGQFQSDVYRIFWGAAGRPRHLGAQMDRERAGAGTHWGRWADGAWNGRPLDGAGAA